MEFNSACPPRPTCTLTYILLHVLYSVSHVVWGSESGGSRGWLGVDLELGRDNQGYDWPLPMGKRGKKVRATWGGCWWLVRYWVNFAEGGKVVVWYASVSATPSVYLDM